VLYIHHQQKLAGLENPAFFMRIGNKKKRKFINKRGCAQTLFTVYNSKVLKGKHQEVFCETDRKNF